MRKDEEEDSACNLMKLSFSFAFSKLLWEQQRRMQHKKMKNKRMHVLTRSEARVGLLASTARCSSSLLLEGSCSTMENKMCWNGYEEARSQ
jgi:hypothetical protein